MKNPDFSDEEIRKRLFDVPDEVVARVPSSLCSECRFIPLGIDGNTLLIAIREKEILPHSIDYIQTITGFSSVEAIYRIEKLNDFSLALQDYYQRQPNRNTEPLFPDDLHWIPLTVWIQSSFSDTEEISFRIDRKRHQGPRCFVRHKIRSEYDTSQALKDNPEIIENLFHYSRLYSVVKKTIDTDITCAKALSLLQMTKDIHIPISTTVDEGMDGVVYTVLIRQGIQESSFIWWCDPPKGWEPLQAIADKLKSLIETNNEPVT